MIGLAFRSWLYGSLAGRDVAELVDVAAVAAPGECVPPCAPGQVNRGAEGSSSPQMTGEEKDRRRLARGPAAATAKAAWLERAKAGQWSEVHTPDSCYRYTADLKTNPRRTSEYAQRVISAVGLQAGGTGYDHLSEVERGLLRDLVGRKAEAFWIEDTPRTVMRGFKHDAVTSGLPVRGHPIRLRGPEAQFVREDLEAGSSRAFTAAARQPGGPGPSRPRPRPCGAGAQWSTTASSTGGWSSSCTTFAAAGTPSGMDGARGRQYR